MIDYVKDAPRARATGGRNVANSPERATDPAAAKSLRFIACELEGNPFDPCER